MADKSETVNKHTTARRVHAFRKDALGKHDAVALAALIRKGELSVAETIQAAIERANAVNSLIHAIEVDSFSEALAADRRPLRSGVFAGVPTFIKDNSDLQGFPTRHGCRAFTPHTAAEDGAYTAQFLAQGFVVLGKSRMPEFGFNASTEFETEEPTRNPWHTGYSAGGSSGGAAALVAAGVVPIAHANDGGGSIRIPAACCGLVGLKPTRDRHRNSRAALSMPVNIISEGVVTRSVRDTAEFFYGMEQVYRNPKLKPIGRVEGPPKHRLRIGVVYDSILEARTCEETRAAVRETALLLEKLGHDVEEVSLAELERKVPKSFIDDFIHYWTFLAFSISAFGKFFFASDFDSQKLDPFTRGLAQEYRKNFWRTPGVLWRLARSAELYAELIRPYDAVLSPVVGHVTPQLGHLSPAVGYEELMSRLSRYILFTPLNNAAGSPAISLPAGLNKDGLPIGIMFQAAHGEERLLLEIAFLLEGERPFPKIY
ncbi:MAG: amidase [Turneriella sp.]|nr:amidase [Turneriella sp.]